MRIDASHLAILLVLINIVAGFLGLLKVFNELGKERAIAAERFGKLEFKTDTMWSYLTGDIMTGAERRGVIQQRSPLRASPEMAQKFPRELGERLSKWAHETRVEDLEESHLLLLIAGNFLPELIDKVVKPLGLNVADALAAAAVICKEKLRDG